MDNWTGKVAERCKLIKVGEQQGLILTYKQMHRVQFLAYGNLVRGLADNYIDAIDDILDRMINQDEYNYDVDIAWSLNGLKGTVSLAG